MEGYIPSVSLLGCWILAIVTAHCVSWFQCQCHRFSAKEVALKVIFLKFKAPEMLTTFQANSTVVATFHSVSCIICYSPKWRRKKGVVETATVSQQPTGCLSTTFPYRVGICASALAWSDVADNLRDRFFLLELHVPYGLPGKRASWEGLLARGMAQCFCALWVRCSRQTWWMCAWPTEIW